MEKKNKSATNTVVIIIVIALIVITSGFLYFKNQSKPKISVGADDGGQLSEQQIADVISAVRRHIVLPEDEDPLVATIVNIDELVAEQAFYQGAQNGDILMIYGSIAKALIYNPREDRLVNVGPVEVQQDPNAPVAPLEQ